MRHVEVIGLGAAVAAAWALPSMARPLSDDDAPGARDSDDSGEILVTARRRLEDAQRIPGSLSVVGGALLDRSYTVNTQQLSQLVPSLTYS